MPESSQKTKKESHSAWVRKRNLRRKYKQSLVSKRNSLKPPAATVDLSENIKRTHSPSQQNKPKSWWAGIKNAFAGHRRNTNDAV